MTLDVFPALSDTEYVYDLLIISREHIKFKVAVTIDRIHPADVIVLYTLNDNLLLQIFVPRKIHLSGSALADRLLYLIYISFIICPDSSIAKHPP